MCVQRASSDPLLKGIHAGSMNDVIHKNWLSKLHNIFGMYKQDCKIKTIAFDYHHKLFVYFCSHFVEHSDSPPRSGEDWLYPGQLSHRPGLRARA